MQRAPVAVEAAFQHKLKFIHIPIQKGITDSNPFLYVRADSQKIDTGYTNLYSITVSHRINLRWHLNHTIFQI